MIKRECTGYINLSDSVEKDTTFPPKNSDCTTLNYAEVQILSDWSPIFTAVHRLFSGVS